MHGVHGVRQGLQVGQPAMDGWQGVAGDEHATQEGLRQDHRGHGLDGLELGPHEAARQQPTEVPRMASNTVTGTSIHTPASNVELAHRDGEADREDTVDGGDQPERSGVPELSRPGPRVVVSSRSRVPEVRFRSVPLLVARSITPNGKRPSRAGPTASKTLASGRSRSEARSARTGRRRASRRSSGRSQLARHRLRGQQCQPAVHGPASDRGVRLAVGARRKVVRAPRDSNAGALPPFGGWYWAGSWRRASGGSWSAPG